MKRKREKAKLTNDSDGVETSDAIVATTSASLSVTTRKKKRTISDMVPIDLLMEILKRFPVKTLARFMCVSKLWASIIRRRDFKKLFLTESTTRQGSSSLIFAFKRHKGYGEDCFFFSSLQTQNPSVAATYHMTYPGDWINPMAPLPSVHGMICYVTPSQFIVYNPSTRRSLTLPKINSQRMCLYHYYLVYDPIDCDYKMLCLTRGGKRGPAQELHVLTLGNENSWRMIENLPPHHSPDSPQMCIDGVLYYGAYYSTGEFVLAPRELQASPFYVLCYDPKKRSVRKVDIEGITEREELPLWDKNWKRRTMSIFPGQVENLMFL